MNMDMNMEPIKINTYLGSQMVRQTFNHFTVKGILKTLSLVG